MEALAFPTLGPSLKRRVDKKARAASHVTTDNIEAFRGQQQNHHENAESL